MRIGILTFHRAYNYGAFLQCYSLQKYIRDNFPEHEVEVIDYYSTNMMKYYEISWKNYILGPYNSLSNCEFKNRFRYFLSFVYRTIFKKRRSDRYFAKKNLQPLFDKNYHFLPLTKEKMVSDSYNESIDFIEKFNFDVIIVGSDAVWNDYQTNIPSVFYLDKKIQAHKLSYAASSYGMQYRDKGRDEIERIARAIDDFEFVGVRDDETERYVKYLLGNKPVIHTCDPTLTLDLESLPVNIAKVKEKLEKYNIDFSKPIVGVMGNPTIVDMVKKIYGCDIQIVSLFEKNKECTVPLLELEPFEWALVFSLFDVTFTSYFHGTIFSLKNGTPTITLEQNVKYSNDYITKTKDLLRRLNLEDYYFAPERQTVEAIKRQIEIYQTQPQRKRILDELEKESKSAEALLNQLNTYKN